MRSLLKKAKKTLENDGVKVLGIRVFNYSIVKLKRLTRKTDKANLEKWKQLKDKYKGERIFVIGNGPSLNRTSVHLLKDEYTMCFNRINLMFERLNFKPDFYVVIDDLVVLDNDKEINTEILPQVKYAFFPDIHPSNVDFINYIDHAENVHWFKSDIPAFRSDLPYCGHNKTVVNAGLQIAAYLGFSEIYMIGVDMAFSDQKVKKITSRDWQAGENDPNHFDPRYFGNGRKYHNPTVPEMIEKFEEGKKFFDKLGVKIYNAGVGGKLEVFPRVNFDSLFNYTDDEIIALFSDIEILKKMNLDFRYVIENAPLVTDASAETFPKIFKADIDLGITLIHKLIHTYAPVGPYKGQYYFVNRSL
ncbi:6-hydroxymethylpterin diphosphokinase MptE-like protein [Foetidibacter luteolus]|uniref:6-hydroxymethylpterin diphosphokinase MptE-like protein n=1 Tax=Foetidibacter luteolus TaxID=2608880 RepID=UPI00129BA3B8|nr:6-hydroxymethylpterin diphosphokinase MptE-like protein [Foetidibacter luteolus]